MTRVVVAGFNVMFHDVASRMMGGGDGATVAGDLRDHVGFSRNIQLPAARQLRTHLRSVIDEIEKASPRWGEIRNKSRHPNR